MRIIYTRKNFVAMPKNEKINILKSGSFEMPGPNFWEKLTAFKNKFLKRT